MLVNFCNVLLLIQLEKFTTIPKEKSRLDAVILELKYFPIPTSILHSEYKVEFQNDFGKSRDSFVAHRHEGCDIIAHVQQSGLYPVVSMTNGIVWKFGYLPLGGYRLGIRTSSNHYYYYAHLASYKKEFKIGDIIHAGDIIGYMGDTGLGREEGTTGKMPVHLHVGIYYFDENNHLNAINPYPYLKQIEKARIKMSY